MKSEPDPDERNPRFRIGNRGLSAIGTLAWALPTFLAWNLSASAQAEDGQGTLTGIAKHGPDNAFPIAALLFLVILYGFYRAAETSLDQLRPSFVRHFRESDPEKADTLQDLINNRPKFVAACDVGGFTALTLLIVMCMIIAPTVGAAAEQYKFVANYSALVVGAILVTLPVTIFTLVVGVVVPKSYAALHPITTSLALNRFIRVSSGVFGIPSSIILMLANLITRRFGAQASFAVARGTEEEIKSLVEDAQEAGELESDERELIHSVFEFGDTVAREVMTPRVDIDALPLSSTAAEVARVIESSGHSRIPLYDGTDDQIVGIVHAKDLLKALATKSDVNLRKIIRTPLFVPENKKLNELLAEMRSNKAQMAVVQDEFGGTAGLLTIEDIVEELVGDIVDEYDEEHFAWTVDADGSYLVDAKMHVDDVNHAIASSIESEEFDTLGGYVFGLFGRQPAIGEQVSDEALVFTVVETDGRRILKLRVQVQERLGVQD